MTRKVARVILYLKLPQTIQCFFTFEDEKWYKELYSSDGISKGSLG